MQRYCDGLEHYATAQLPLVFASGSFDGVTIETEAPAPGGSTQFLRIPAAADLTRTLAIGDYNVSVFDASFKVRFPALTGRDFGDVSTSQVLSVTYGGTPHVHVQIDSTGAVRVIHADDEQVLGQASIAGIVRVGEWASVRFVMTIGDSTFGFMSCSVNGQIVTASWHQQTVTPGLDQYWNGFVLCGGATGMDIDDVLVVDEYGDGTLASHAPNEASITTHFFDGEAVDNSGFTFVDGAEDYTNVTEPLVDESGPHALNDLTGFRWLGGTIPHVHAHKLVSERDVAQTFSATFANTVAAHAAMAILYSPRSVSVLA
jgi:hypothetical protein